MPKKTHENTPTMAEPTNSAAVTGDRRESVAVTESVRASEAVSRPSKPGKSFKVLGESTRPYMVHAPSAGPHSDGHAPQMMPSVRNSTYTNANQGAPFCNPAYGMRPAWSGTLSCFCVSIWPEVIGGFQA